MFIRSLTLLSIIFIVCTRSVCLAKSNTTFQILNISVSTNYFPEDIAQATSMASTSYTSIHKNNSRARMESGTIVPDESSLSSPTNGLTSGVNGNSNNPKLKNANNYFAIRLQSLGKGGKKNEVSDDVEYTALVNLYQEADGAQWIKKKKWLTGTTAKQMKQWEGIKFKHDDVSEITLSQNNLRGILPESVGSLIKVEKIKLDGNYLSGAVPFGITRFQDLKQIELQNNQLSSFPDFSLHPNLSKLQVDVSNNQLDFGDLEPNFRGPGQPYFKKFLYSGQGLLGLSDTLNYRERSRLQIKLLTGGEHNIYQWQKRDMVTEKWNDIIDATSSKLNIFPLQLADSGQYRCVVTNTWVPNLKLYTQVYTVQVEEYREVPFVIDGTKFPNNIHYRILVDTINEVRPLSSIQKFTLINPTNTTRTLISLQDTEGNNLGSGYTFNINSLGQLSELYYQRGMEETILYPTLYKVDSSYLQIFPLSQLASSLPYQLELQQGIIYRPLREDGTPQKLVVNGIPDILQQYSFQVFDADGSLIFTTQDPTEFWNGFITDSSTAASGVYRYQLRVNNQEIVGQFILKN